MPQLALRPRRTTLSNSNLLFGAALVLSLLLGVERHTHAAQVLAQELNQAAYQADTTAPGAPPHSVSPSTVVNFQIPASAQPAVAQAPASLQPAGSHPSDPQPSSAAPSTPTTPAAKASPPSSTTEKSNDSLSLPAFGKKPTEGDATDQETKSGKSQGSLGSTLFSVLSSLAVVLGLFLLLAWFMKRSAPKGMGRLPDEVLEVLGQAPLASRQSVHLIRLGAKLILVNVSSAGIETVAEVDDPVEVDRLAGLCKQTEPESSSSVFRNVFQQFSRESSSDGFLGDATESNITLANRDKETRDPNQRSVSSRRPARGDNNV